MAQSSGFDPTTQVKTYFNCKMFDVANWVACLNGEYGPGGTPSHEALSVSSQGALEISSVAGQPSWTETISAHLEWWQNPTNVMKGADLHPRDHSIQLFTDASNEGWGAHLEQTSTKGLWSDRGKKLHINVLELKAVSLALQSFKDQCKKPKSFGSNRQLNSSGLHFKVYPEQGKQAFLLDFVHRMLHKKAVTLVRMCVSLGFYSSMFSFSKSGQNGGW